MKALEVGDPHKWALPPTPGRASILSTYVLQTEEFIKSYGSSNQRLYVLKLNLILGRADYVLDRLECDYNQGLFPTWKVYGPNFGGNDIMKKIREKHHRIVE